MEKPLSDLSLSASDQKAILTNPSVRTNLRSHSNFKIISIASFSLCISLYSVAVLHYITCKEINKCNPTF